MNSIDWAFLIVVAVVGLADLQGPGHGYGTVVGLSVWYMAARQLGPNGWRKLWSALLVLSIAMDAYAVVQMAYMPRAIGIFGSANFFAGYVVLHLFLALYVSRIDDTRYAMIGRVAVVTNAIALFLAQGRGALVAAAICIVIALGRKAPRTALALSVAFVSVAVFEYFARMYGETDARWGLWRIGLHIAIQRPLLGWGQNGIIVWGGWNHFYNIAIDWFVSCGILGIISGVYLVVRAFRAALRIDKDSPNYALVAFLSAWMINGMFIYDTAATTVPLITMLAFLASEQGREKSVAAAVDYNQPLLDSRV